MGIDKPVIKRLIFILFLLTLAAAVIWAANFYWQNLRGALPAFRKTSQNIVELIEKAATTTNNNPAKPAENKTGMPLKLPDGFSTSIFAKNLPGARVMKFDLFGNMWVSRTGENAVTLLEVNDDGTINHQGDIFRNLRKPHGLAFDPEFPSTLYIAEEHRVKKVAVYSEDEGTKILDLPFGKGHFTRTIEFGPDGKLYISIGSSCNVCIENDKFRASIFRYDPSLQEGATVFARGLRNAVFFTWHPKTAKMWATEMGRDLLGDDIPPDEINIIGGPSTNSGQNSIPNFGWPNCYGKNVHDTNFDKNTYIRNPCMEPFETPSYIDLQAHSAPLGLAFIPATADFPKEYWHDLLVAYHGSWNKTEPTGYKIVRFKLDENGNHQGMEDFITGWLTSNNEVLGRPVDILIREGAIYISDDKAGVIYKVEPRN